MSGPRVGGGGGMLWARENLDGPPQAVALDSPGALFSVARRRSVEPVALRIDLEAEHYGSVGTADVALAFGNQAPDLGELRAVQPELRSDLVGELRVRERNRKEPSAPREPLRYCASCRPGFAGSAQR